MAIYPSKISVFLLGFTIGVIIAFISLVSRDKVVTFNIVNYPTYLIGNTDGYQYWLHNLGFRRKSVNFDKFSYSGNKSLNKLLESQLLASKVNVLCVMFVHNTNNAYAAMNGWMKQCNAYKFYSTKSVKYFEVTSFKTSNSWHYLCEVIRHVNENFQDIMWVLFVPDNVFAIPENLRRYIFNLNFETPYYMGHRAVFWNQLYNIAQGGFVLSKGSIKALANKFSTSEHCQKSGEYLKKEDYYLGKYLSELGITPTDTRDHFGRNRFHLFTPAQLIAPGNEAVLKKYWKTSLHPGIQGFNCCSPQSITFQGTDKTQIYFYDYILYKIHLHLEPGSLGNAKSRIYTPSNQVWEQFVLDELGPSTNLSSISDNMYYDLWRNKIDSPMTFAKRLRELFTGKSED